MTAEQTWEAIEDEVRRAAPSHGRVRRLVPSPGGRNLYLAVHMPSGQRMLQYESTASSDLGAPPSTGAVTSAIEVQPDGLIRVTMTLADPAVRAVFTAFVDDVIEHVATAPDDHSGHSALLERHRHWRRLLSGGDRRLTEAQRQGLCGELWTLAHLIEPEIGGAAAIRSWIGPEAGDQDFRTTTSAVEVKSVRAGAHSFVVSNKRQLDPRDLHELLIVVLTVEPVNSGGADLNELVDLTRWLAPPAEQPVLEDRLLECGYRDADREHYSSPRWDIRSAYLYRVAEGFPRLLESDLPAGIEDVSYNVSLAACEPWRVALDRLHDLLTP